MHKPDNSFVASLFNEMASLMELHQESPFKIKSYNNAYQTIRRLDQDIIELNIDQRKTISGIGEAISAKIEEIKKKNTFDALERMRSSTPEGIIEMLKIRGLGPKKIRSIWKELGIEEIGELLYACEENRLSTLSGFGQKTQNDIREKVLFMLDNKGFYLFSKVKDRADSLIDILYESFPDALHSLCGDIRRAMPVISKIEVITTLSYDQLMSIDVFNLESGHFIFQEIPVAFYFSNRMCWGKDLAIATGGFQSNDLSSLKEFEDEISFFKEHKLTYIIPERREDIFKDYPEHRVMVDPISLSDIKGVLHAHSTFSDGSTTLEELSDYCKAHGFTYLGITDHSRSAYYANGLSVDRVYQQIDLIDSLNKSTSGFYIFKGIESDILNDGSLDYPEDVLQQFDFIIASIHSNLRMSEDQATSRLIKAIENPYTRILGHPTGRLLLSRKGYQPNLVKVIDAACQNKVAIELNANPLRLDLDYTWIPYAVDKGLMLSINSDAHNLKSIHDIRWGVYAANKGALPKEMCLTCLEKEAVLNFFRER